MASRNFEISYSVEEFNGVIHAGKFSLRTTSKILAEQQALKLTLQNIADEKEENDELDETEFFDWYYNIKKVELSIS